MMVYVIVVFVGGALVGEQIADLKRGSDIVVCTPGRMIEILCMQAGKLVSLRRVTMVVLDEADRLVDRVMCALCMVVFLYVLFVMSNLIQPLLRLQMQYSSLV